MLYGTSKRPARFNVGLDVAQIINFSLCKLTGQESVLDDITKDVLTESNELLVDTTKWPSDLHKIHIAATSKLRKLKEVMLINDGE